MELARKPDSVSLCDLIVNGFLSEDDVDEHGKVCEEKRRHAENEYIKTKKIKRPQRPRTANSTTHSSKFENVELKCTICFTNNRSHIFIPCFHFYSCRECAMLMNRCPICRKEIEYVQRVWY